VNLLEKQLPSKSEMDALLSDINQAGLGRSLQFELFRPGSPWSGTITRNCRSP
jgi:type IV pilus assembly protein PilO